MVIRLQDLDGTDGFVVVGDGFYDRAGFEVNGGGDVNGDGIDDFVVVGASQPEFPEFNTASFPSETYLIYGRDGGFERTLDLGSLDGTDGTRLHYDGDEDFLFISSSIAGDFNNDGIDDVVIGSFGPERFNGPGYAFVVYGQPGGLGAAVDLETLDGADGFAFEVMTTGGPGGPVSFLGDVNGDDFDDIAVGADDAGVLASGITYVVYGTDAAPGPLIDGADLDGSDGSRLMGAELFEGAGRTVAAAGDVNGDGLPDLLVGASLASPYGRSEAGVVYVVFGDAAGFPADVDLGALDGMNGFRVVGPTATGFIGIGDGLAGIGDVNGDGFDDIALGLRFGNTAYVLYGNAGAFDDTIDLAQFDASQGFRIVGTDGGSVGSAIAPAGDVNGDGRDDFILGDPASGGSGPGGAHVVFGRDSGFGATLDLATLTLADGATLIGPEGVELLGFSVAGAGDVNDDGFDDVLVSAPSEGILSSIGSAYLVFGAADFGTSNLTGGDGPDELTGGPAADVIMGLGGDDVLSGLGGDDDLQGGPGDDVLIGGAGADLLQGGDDVDTASYVTATTGVEVDLGAGTAARGDAAGDVLTGIENLTGGAGFDTLTGDAGPNRIEGGPGQDTLDGAAGDDVILGGDRNDRLTGGAGMDDVRGEAGDDYLIARGDGDRIDGGAGVDTVDYTSGPPTLDVRLYDSAGPGGDVLIGIENVVGNSGDDFIAGNSAANRLLGLDGNDLIRAGSAADTVLGGIGDDVIRGQDGDDRLYGGPGADFIDGGAGLDTVSLAQEGIGVVAFLDGTPGGTGDRFVDIEIVEGSVGDDVVTGTAAAETLSGWLGNDTLMGGSGGDRLDGSSGNDWLFGGFGRDMLTGSRGADQLTGGDGRDILDGGPGEDWTRYDDATAGVSVRIYDGTASDGDTLTAIEHIAGGRFGDYLAGNSGVNHILGGDGADQIRGGSADDVLVGGAGADLIFGQEGDDRIWGELGRDIFVHAPGDGHDRIEDYAFNGDRLDLRAHGIADFAAFLALTTDTAEGALVQIDGANSVLLVGVLEAEIGQEDVLIS